MEEISLRELIEIFLKRKKIIIISTIAALLIVSIYTFFIATPLYKSEMIISLEDSNYINLSNIYSSNGDTYLQSSDIIQEDNRSFINQLLKYSGANEISIENLVRSTAMLEKVLKRTVSNMSVEELQNKLQFKDDNNLLTITATDTNPQVANSVLVGVIDELNGYMKENNLSIIGRQIGLIDDLIRGVEQQIADLDNKISIENRNITGIEAKKLDSAIEANTSLYELLILKKEQLIMLSKVSTINKIKISKEPTFSYKPYNVNKKLNLAIAAVLGLMLGVFTAFFLEYWEESGKAEKGGSHEVL